MSTPGRQLRRAAARLAAGAGLVDRLERRMIGGLTILTYHRVLPAPRCRSYLLRSLAMPVEAFEAQVRSLARRCEVLPVAEALARHAERPAATRPLVSLTFDDGYRDNAEHAAGVLEEHGVRGTFFITAGLIADARTPWFDLAAISWEALGPHAFADAAAAACVALVGAPAPATLPAAMRLLKALPPAERASVVAGVSAVAGARADHADALMTVEQVRALARAGHEVGSHSMTHPLLPQCSGADLRQELAGSRSLIASWLGAPPAGFCYPNGDVDDRVAGAARDAGYAYACTTAPGINQPGSDPLRLRRVDVSAERVADGSGRHDEHAFRALVAGLGEGWA
jgi:peptidoglycan/xylan/chitin deacetylase (PgdA/CDA1 family)